MSQQARYWLLTIPANDYQQHTSLPDTINFIRGQQEIGSDTGYAHWQLLVAFKRAVRLAAVKSIFGQHCHAEPSRSGAATEYVWKDDTSVPGTRFELGAKPMQRNSKTDWEAAKLLARSGKIDDVPADVYIKYYRTLKEIARDNMDKPNDLSGPCGIWIHGPPGVGKSHYARQHYGPDIFFKPQNKWWDGYQQEKSVLIDDFDSKQLGHLLKIWADKYSFVAETKGSSIHIRPDRLIITSNYPIETIFNEDQSLCDAVKRRFYIIHIPMRMG